MTAILYNIYYLCMGMLAALGVMTFTSLQTMAVIVHGPMTIIPILSGMVMCAALALRANNFARKAFLIFKWSSLILLATILLGLLMLAVLVFTGFSSASMDGESLGGGIFATYGFLLLYIQSISDCPFEFIYVTSNVFAVMTATLSFAVVYKSFISEGSTRLKRNIGIISVLTALVSVYLWLLPLTHIPHFLNNP